MGVNKVFLEPSKYKFCQRNYVPVKFIAIKLSEARLKNLNCF